MSLEVSTPLVDRTRLASFSWVLLLPRSIGWHLSVAQKEVLKTDDSSTLVPKHAGWHCSDHPMALSQVPREDNAFETNAQDGAPPTLSWPTSHSLKSIPGTQNQRFCTSSSILADLPLCAGGGPAHCLGTVTHCDSARIGSHGWDCRHQDLTQTYQWDSLPHRRSLPKCLTPMLDSQEHWECECSNLWYSGRWKFQKLEKLYWFMVYRNLPRWTNVERLKLTWLNSYSTPHSHSKSELKSPARQWEEQGWRWVVKALVSCLGRDTRMSSDFTRLVYSQAAIYLI